MSTIVLLSGGIDSTTLLHSAVNAGERCIALSFMYQQMHRKELDYARATAQRLGVEHRIIELPNIFAQSALTGDKPMPSGHYTDSSMRQTVVPNRNMVFLAIATSVAIQINADSVSYAAHADDFGTYPDCRPEFVATMAKAIAVCDYKPPTLYVPFLTLTKRKIVNLGLDLGIDYDTTWSCYAGGAEHCGKCGACSARMEALA